MNKHDLFKKFMEFNNININSLAYPSYVNNWKVNIKFQ
jgi:hypothetical protein